MGFQGNAHPALTEPALRVLFFYFMFLMGMIHSQPRQIRSLCSKSLKFSRVWLHKRVRNKLNRSVPTDFQGRLAPGKLKLFRQHDTKIISSCTPPFSGICYLPNWQLEQKFCSFSSSDSSERSETASVCALAVSASMQDANGITVPSHGEEQKEETNPFLCPKGEMLCLLWRMWQGDWQYGLPGIDKTSVGVFSVLVNFRLVALLQVGSALSTRLAPVHVECSKVMLIPLSMSKLQPTVCNQLSRAKRAHSASPATTTVKKEYLCETLISDSLACQNHAWFWFWHKTRQVTE